MNARRSIAALALLAAAAPVGAGTFLQFGSSQPSTVVHPNGTSTSGGEFFVDVCLDPAAMPGNANLNCQAPGANPTQCNPEQAIRNVVATFNRDESVLGNVTNNDVGHVDFESVLMHEAGHCVGMGHNALGPSELSTQNFGNPQLYFSNAKPGSNGFFDTTAGADLVRGTRDDTRGDDVNIGWFRKGVNDPWAIPSGVIDRNTFGVNLADLPVGYSFVEISTAFGPCNGNQPNSSSAYGQPATNNVMFPVLCTNRFIRDLAPDDLSQLRIARSGFDGSQGTSDDYFPRLRYVGISSSCDIVVQFVNNAGFAFCSAGGSSGGPIPAGNIVITTALAKFQNTVDWHFNQTDTTGGGVQPANLALTMDSSTSNVRPGETITYTLTITNGGPAVATSTVVTNATADGFEFVSNSGNCTTAFPCALGDLASGATRTITSVFRVESSHTGGGAINNEASVASNTLDNTLANNAAAESVTIWAPQADLAVTISDGGALAVPGGTVEYDVGVDNLGPSDATNVVLTFPLPNSTSFDSGGGNGWVCNANASTVTCTRSTLVANTSAPFTIAVDIPGNYNGPAQLTGTAAITSATIDPSDVNNSAADLPSDRIFCGNFEDSACAGN